MSTRRAFLTRSGLALGALLVGDEVLDTFARLTHTRKTFPSAGITDFSDWRNVVKYSYSNPMTATEVLERRAAMNRAINLYLERRIRLTPLYRNATPLDS